ncbi:acid protease [Lophium mytilinum]|uniref:Acid protease n=1 Tax=Lophium mytilinum TaxID=390894 RepID=A0A6A6QGD4_9PEZI|nr:acid protease [Lophium mytilinum]
MPINPSTIGAACLSLLPFASAFYPYTPVYTDTPTPRSRSLRLDSRIISREGSFSLPIHRTPLKRTNTYSIINNNTPKQSDSVAVDQDGTDFSYMVAVTFGTSSEEYHMLVDAASSNTWVMSSECETDSCKTHSTFGKEDSTSLTTSDETFSIVYGTGQVNGTVASDDVHVGDLSASLTFGLGIEVSSEFASYPMDGILGLGRGDSTSNAIEAPSLMDDLSTKSLIKAKLFGLHLSRTSDDNNDGELNFGAPNTERYSGSLNYMSVIENDDGFWEIPLDDAGVNDKTLGLKGRSAIIDSGTSWLMMPEDDAVALHKLIPGYTQSGETFTVPCTSKQSVQLTFGGVVYDVSTADYIGGKLSNGACSSKIIGRQTFGPHQWLVGDVFLKNVYTVFDLDDSRVGFGVKAEETVASTTVSSSPSAKGSPTASGTAFATEASTPTGTAAATAESQQQSPSATASPTDKGAAIRNAPSRALLSALFMIIVSLYR